MRAGRRWVSVPFPFKKTGHPMIHVVAIITAKPGQRAAVLEHFQANVPAVHAEAGCIEYGAAGDVENMGTAAYGPDSFVVIEKWEREDHLMLHAERWDREDHLKVLAADRRRQPSGPITTDFEASRSTHADTPV